MRLLLSLTVILGSFVISGAELTLDQILQKNLEAMGGAENLAKISSLKLTAKMATGGIDAPLVTFLTKSGKVRSDVQIPGQTIISAFDGTIGWTINSVQGQTKPEKLDAKMTETVASSDMVATLGCLKAMKDAGYTITLIGTAGGEFQLKLVRKTGLETRYYLSAKTFLPVRTVITVQQSGQDLEVESLLTDYRPVSGVPMAHGIENRIAGRSVMQIQIEKFEVNTPLEDSLFAMPNSPKQ